MNTVLNNNVISAVSNYFVNKRELTTDEIMDYLSKDFPSWKASTIKTYLTKLKSEGVIHSAGRGRYIQSTLPEYKPKSSNRMKSISSKIKKSYPLLNYCLWDTEWFNEFQRHQLFRTNIVLEVERDGMESVFYLLSETGKDVFLMPSESDFERYLSAYAEPIVIEPLISESPLLMAGKIPVPSLEKLLVDAIANPILYSAQQGELTFIFESAFEKYAINIARMNRYAARRNQSERLHRLLDQKNK